MKNLTALFEKYGITLSKKQGEQFDLFFNLLIETNKFLNLTAITEENEVSVKHFLDSCVAEKFFDKNASVVDVGAGAGFPSIPLKITRPDLSITMVDSLLKRVNFLNEVIEKEGFEVELLDVSKNANITPEQVKNAIRDNTCLVTVMFANNEIGSILPIAEIGAICREKGILFHTDAVQAAGHLHINVAEQNIDMLSLSAHKFHGPKGIGVLYAKKGIPLTVLIEGGAQERGKRAGTENQPAIISMAAALKEADANLDVNAARMSRLRDKLIDGLSKIEHSALNGTRENRLPGNVNFIFEGIEGESLLLLLDDRGICASSGSACTSGSLDPSHVLLAIGRPHEIAHGSLRLSLSEWTTEEEIDYMLEQIPVVVKYLRNMSPLWREKVNGEKQFVL